jgi:hypothetical protein
VVHDAKGGCMADGAWCRQRNRARPPRHHACVAAGRFGLPAPPAQGFFGIFGTASSRHGGPPRRGLVHLSSGSKGFVTCPSTRNLRRNSRKKQAALYFLVSSSLCGLAVRMEVQPPNQTSLAIKTRSPRDTPLRRTKLPGTRGT